MRSINDEIIDDAAHTRPSPSHEPYEHATPGVRPDNKNNRAPSGEVQLE
jgi:hypothetical protein